MGLSVVNQRRDGRQQRPHHHREASPMGGSQVGWEPDTTHTPRQAQGQTGTLSYVWWWCVGFVSGWCNRKREDQGSSCCIQIARFVLGCWRVRGPEKCWLLPIAFGLDLCALCALSYAVSHSLVLTRVSTFYFFTSNAQAGGRGRAAGKTRDPQALQGYCRHDTRAKPTRVHHGLQTTTFVAAAGGDSHGVLLGLCDGPLALVVVAACPWTRLEHGQRIALLWDRGPC